MPFEGSDIWFLYNIVSSAIVIRGNAVEVQFHGKCLDGYLEWYFIVSRTRIIPPADDDVEPSNGGGPSDDVPPSLSSMTDQ